MKRIRYNEIFMARVLEIAIGLYFVAGAIPKFLDIDKFVLQIAAYKVIEAPVLLEWSALFTVFMEMCLGMFLILGVRMKGLTILALQGVIVVFSVLITYAWRVHGLEDCGCFPIFKMSPPVSLMKNGLTLAASLYILWVFSVKGVWARTFGSDVDTSTQEPLAREKAKFEPLRMLVKISLSIVVAVGCMAYSRQSMDREALEQDAESEGGLFSQFELFMPEGYFNLAQGLYLVAVMSSSCPECKENVPALNDLYQVPDIPPMVALCYEETPGELDVFKSITNPLFPVYSLGDRALLYFKLLEKESFRFVLVLDGRPVASWDGFVPDSEELQENIDRLHAAG